MNATTLSTNLLKSLTTKATPRPKGERVAEMVSAATRRELSAMRKLSRPMDEATAEYLATQRIRHQKWARA